MQTATIATSSPLRTHPQSERGNYAVILASGAEDGGKRATLALSAACSAQAMGLSPTLFLVGDGVPWVWEGGAEGVHAPWFPPLSDLMETFIECGGQVFL